MAPVKRKRTHTQIRSNIPLHKDSVVTRVEVTQVTKQQILAKLRKVSVPVPVAEPASLKGPPPQTSEPDLSIPANTPKPPINKTCNKGPSCSVTVRSHSYSLL